jgi:6,7-dimethyl-8-ribityllumazine synthase
MAGKGSSAGASTRVAARVLIIEAPYYEDVSKELAAGALAELKARGATFDRIEVPGALEIPQVLTLASAAGLFYGNPLSTKPSARYAGAVALGCVIRGETSHYDIVCNNANHWLIDVAVHNAIPIGNAILTVDTEAQAMARAKGGREGKGGDAVRACLAVIALERVFADEELE